MMAKRLFDIFASLFFLALLWPWLLLIALAVKLDSPGKAFFIQKRAGLGGRDFKLLKFRTMTELPAAANGLFEPGQKTRITRLGKLLRRLKFDELPQLINVLKGDMSMVGPRPEVRRWVEVYPKRWAVILTVRPGITDEASILFRNEEELLAASNDPEQCYREQVLPRKLALYENYVANHSLIGDFKIIIKTIKVVIFSS